MGGSIMVGAPHTSNWDFFLMYGIAWGAGLEVRWLGKEELFRGLAGPFMRMLGGIPVPRDNPGDLTKRLSADLIQQKSHAGKHAWALVIAPEGTRSRTDYWKSGFYRIARDADLPLILGFVDKSTRTVGLGPTVLITGNPRRDMDLVRRFYAGKVGVNPGEEGVPRLRIEETSG